MDIVERLRNNKKAKWDLDNDGGYIRHIITDPLSEEAANEIERLRTWMMIAALMLSERGLTVPEKNEMAYEHLLSALKKRDV